MFNFGSSTESHYIRTTSQLKAEVPLKFPDSSQIRFFSRIEADKLAATVRQRNVFARHSWENNFYLKQVAQLADRTIIEVYRAGDPNTAEVLSLVPAVKQDASCKHLKGQDP